MKKLDGKIAVVTGGSSGIGQAVAKIFLAEGAQVIITGRKKESIDSALLDGGLSGFVVDHTNMDQIKKLAEDVKDAYGKIDILFLNAGIAAFSPMEMATEEHYDALMNLNVKGTYFTVKHLIPLIREGGVIVFNASVNASIAAPGSTIYAASKAALLAINRVLSKELATRNIRVNAISPGPVDTPLYDKLGLTAEQKQRMNEHLSGKMLGHRFAQPQEVANLVCFLVSPESSFITGTEITIDGGLTLDPTN